MRALRQGLGARADKVPTRELSDEEWRALAETSLPLEALLPQLGRHLDATGAKAERLLGWHTRPLDTTIVETGESLLAL